MDRARTAIRVPRRLRQPGRRTGRKERISPESVFAELLSLAAIPQAAYAVDEEVPGAMCLVEADGGFEVFSRTDDARLEVHFFEDEEAAYFLLVRRAGCRGGPQRSSPAQRVGPGQRIPQRIRPRGPLRPVADLI